MKRILVFIFIFIHLFSTVGFSMEIHECGGKKEYSFYGVHLGGNCSCNHDDEKHSDNCCKDKKTVIKSIKKECQVNKIIVAKTAMYFDFTPAFLIPSKVEVVCIRPAKKYFAEHPPNNSPPLYIMYNVFRI